MITLSKQKKVAAWSPLVLPTTSTETLPSPLHTMIKSSLKFLDYLIGYPETSNLPSSLYLYPIKNTTSGIAPIGKYLNTLLFDHTLASIRNSLEKRPFAPAPAAIIVAPLTLPNTTDIHNNQHLIHSPDTSSAIMGIVGVAVWFILCLLFLSYIWYSRSLNIIKIFWNNLNIHCRFDIFVQYCCNIYICLI